MGRLPAGSKQFKQQILHRLARMVSDAVELSDPAGDGARGSTARLRLPGGSTGRAVKPRPNGVVAAAAGCCGVPKSSLRSEGHRG
jgi:hypothetical protein